MGAFGLGDLEDHQTKRRFGQDVSSRVAALAQHEAALAAKEGATEHREQVGDGVHAPQPEDGQAQHRHGTVTAVR